MDARRKQGPTCRDCLNALEEKPPLPPPAMITPNGHGTPLKNPQNLTAGSTLNGGMLLRNGQSKAHLLKTHINNHANKNGHAKATRHLDLVKESLCCFKQPSKSSGKKDQDCEDQDDDQSCGLLSFKPRWLQPLANKKVFLAVFCLTSVLQGMYYTYFVSVLTTLEKLYQIQSKTTGLIMSATEVGQIGGALLLTYYGGQGHRPKWIAWGMLVFAAASIFCATPHFLYSEMTNPMKSASVAENSSTSALKELQTKLCHSRTPLSPAPRTSGLLSNGTGEGLAFFDDESATNSKLSYNRSARATNTELSVHNASSSLSPVAEPWVQSRSECEDKSQAVPRSKATNTVLIIFFISLLLIGIGATAVYTLGIPYIDDNVATRESPLYFGITIGVRIFGPVFGFLLGSFCTSMYVNFPFETTELTTDNPQWVGAWWLGVLFVGAALLFVALPMMSFPKKLPRPCKHQKAKDKPHKVSQGELLKCNGNMPQAAAGDCRLCQQSTSPPTKSNEVSNPSLKAFPIAIKRLVRNEILLYRTASSVLHILPIAGLYTFLPKYLESQFQLTATMANMISGVAGILVMGIGIFASGTFMRTFKPSARFVALWIALSAALYAIGMLILMLFGCPLNSYVGLNAGSQYEDTTQMSCNETCSCKPGEFSPICTSEGVTYLSPCLAGCTAVSGASYDEVIYENCLCLGPNVTATNGFCPLQCDKLLPYVFVFALFVLVHSTSEVGSMLLTLRCVERRDKAMALGLIAFAIGLFGNVPCPIIYGAVVDSACLFWEDNCGELGACRLYDPSKFRTVFHGVTAVIMIMAFFVDIVVFIKAKSIQFEEEEIPPGSEDETQPINEPLPDPQGESTV